MATVLDDHALDQLFRAARTHNKWQDKPVPESLLRQAWELAIMGPTGANCCPARLVFVVSAEAKERLKPSLMPANVDKTMAAPVTAIVGHDLEFFERMPRLYPQVDARSWYVGNPALAEATAFRNGCLQAAYFILACRAVGLDCGPMGGFDNAKVDDAFFAGTTIRSNILINIGYGNVEGLRPRNPRPSFAEDCTIR